MICEINNFEFIKVGNTVNVWIGNKNIDVFTDYEIKTKKQFRKACEEYLNEE
jgi:hypothetical protein